MNIMNKYRVDRKCFSRGRSKVGKQTISIWGKISLDYLFVCLFIFYLDCSEHYRTEWFSISSPLVNASNTDALMLEPNHLHMGWFHPWVRTTGACS